MSREEHRLYPGLRVTIEGERRQVAEACGRRDPCARIAGDPPAYLRAVAADGDAGPLARAIEVVTLAPGGGEPPSAARFHDSEVAHTRHGIVLQDREGRAWPVRSVHRTTYDALEPARPPLGANLPTLRLALGILAALLVFAWIVGAN